MLASHSVGHVQRFAFLTRSRPNFRSTTCLNCTQKLAVADDKFVDYKPTTAFFFPGQGAQSLGMGKEVVEEVPAAKELFDKASDILGYDLLKVCVEGPVEKLNSTAVSQPAIYVASLAAVEKLRTTDAAVIESCDVTCGLSLGEYTSLAFAGAMSFEDGLKLVNLRGKAMQAAADAEPSAMVSVIGLDAEQTAELCAAATKEVGEENAVQIANYLCKGNYAVSGSVEGCDVIERIAKPDFKARMTVRLAVAGAFHTKYMQPAVEQLLEALSNTEIVTPRIPVISNVDAAPHSSPEAIKEILSRQVTSPVQWETTLQTLLEKGLVSSYELGPGKVIAGIMKRVNRKHAVTNISV